MKPLHRLLALAALAFCLSTPAAAEKAVAESDFSAYKELAQTKLDAARESLQKDVQALGTRVDNQDKRIDQQGNRIGDVSISLTWFGILLTILAIIAGFVGYFTVSAKARKEAQEEADKAVNTWLSGHEAELQRQIKAAEAFAAESRTRIQDFEKEIAELRAQVTEKMSNYIADFESSLEEDKQRLQEKIAKIAEGGSKQVTPEEQAAPEGRAALQALDEKLRHKPEADYGFEDWNNRAFAAYSRGNHEEAARYWKQAADAPDASPIGAAKALFNAGASSEQSGRHDDAIAAYELLGQRYASATETALREQVAKALFNKGVILGELGRADDEIAAYELLDQRYASIAEPALRERVAIALFNKGVSLGELGRADDAIAAYELLDRRYAGATETALRERVAKALLNKSHTLRELGRADDSIAAYELLDQRYAGIAEPALREQVARALFNKGVTLGKLGRADDAITAYDLLDERYASATEPALRELVAKAHNGRGFTLLCRAKENWLNEASRLADLEQAAGLFLGAEHDNNDKPIVLGNRAYCAHLRGQPVELVRPLLEAALKDGGEKLYKATLDDLAIHPVPPDAEFRRLLDEVWVSLGNALPDADKPQS
jgi:TolA-binding protein